MLSLRLKDASLELLPLLGGMAGIVPAPKPCPVLLHAAADPSRPIANIDCLDEPDLLFDPPTPYNNALAAAAAAPPALLEASG